MTSKWLKYDGTYRKPHPLAGLTIEEILKLSRTQRKLRTDLTEEQKLEAASIGRIEFKSAGATRKR